MLNKQRIQILKNIMNLQEENEKLKNKIGLALLEIAHIEGEKTPTEIRVEQALKGSG